jgi:hypothetical protein
LRQNLRVDHDDVRHGHEGGQAGEEFDANGGIVFAKMEYPLEQLVVPGKARNCRPRGKAPSNAKNLCERSDISCDGNPAATILHAVVDFVLVRSRQREPSFRHRDFML